MVCVVRKWSSSLLAVSVATLDYVLLTEVEKFIEVNTQKQSEQKYLCPLSGKKFKGPEFVRKHIFNKHLEKVEEVKLEVIIYHFTTVSAHFCYLIFSNLILTLSFVFHNSLHLIAFVVSSSFVRFLRYSYWL